MLRPVHIGFGALLVAAAPVAAQCDGPGTWLPGDGLNGLNGPVYACTAWDPDGTGPLPEVLAAAGRFSFAGTVSAINIAAWDGATGEWRALGAGLSGTNGEQADVYALTVFEGDLVAGGAMTGAGGRPVGGIARWDGAEWTTFGSGVEGWVLALAEHDGDLIAGGFFSRAGGVPANGVARWSSGSAAWSALGTGVPGAVNAVAVYNGELYVGGQGVRRWNGTSWELLPGGLFSAVNALGVFQDELVAAGSFSVNIGGVMTRGIARWDGTAWHSLGTGMPSNGIVRALGVQDSDLYIAGAFSAAGGVAAANVARWDGAAWHAVGSGTDAEVRAVCVYGDEVALGGTLMAGGGAPAARLALWNPTTAGWRATGEGTSDAVGALGAHAGQFVAGGRFNSIEGAPAARVARWDAGAAEWRAMGGGMRGGNPNRQAVVAAFTEYNGALIAGGEFMIAGEAQVRHIARWDPAVSGEWVPLGTGMGAGASGNGAVLALAVYGGELIAAGYFSSAGGVGAASIARWDGATGAWAPVGGGMGTMGEVNALALYDGELIAAGSFTLTQGAPGNRIAAWDGATWRQLGTGMAGFLGVVSVNALAVYNGELIAGGSFTSAGGTPANYIARWDGAAWHPLGAGTSGQVNALAVVGDELVVGGSFVNRAARWDGASWSPLGAGTDGSVLALAGLDGLVVLGGDFRAVGDELSVYLGRWAPPPRLCPVDFNCSGAVDSQDFFDYLSTFFGSPPPARADFNRDGATNSQDFFDFLGAFFNGCP